MGEVRALLHGDHELQGRWVDALKGTHVLCRHSSWRRSVGFCPITDGRRCVCVQRQDSRRLPL
eukprot:3115309-Rhodomonas_salina.1